MREQVTYIDSEDKLVVRTVYDNSETIELNKRLQNDAASLGMGRYASNSGLVRVGNIEMGDIVRLKNLGYNLLSPDQDEVRRALLYIQSNEPHLLTVPGKPIAKVKQKWH